MIDDLRWCVGPRLGITVFASALVGVMAYYFFYLPELRWEQDPKNAEEVAYLKDPSCPVAWESDPPSGEPFSAHFPQVPHTKYSSRARMHLSIFGVLATALITYFLVSQSAVRWLGWCSAEPMATTSGPKTLTPWADRVSHIIGTFAVTIMTLATLLQLHKTVRTASIESFSMWSIILFAVADSLWLTNSLVRGNHSLTVEKVLAVIVGVALVIAGTSRKQVAKEREPKLVCRA